MVGGGFVDEYQVSFGEDVVEYSARVLVAVLYKMLLGGGSRGAVSYSFHDCFQTDTRALSGW